MGQAQVDIRGYKRVGVHLLVVLLEALLAGENRAVALGAEVNVCLLAFLHVSQMAMVVVARADVAEQRPLGGKPFTAAATVVRARRKGAV